MAVTPIFWEDKWVEEIWKFVIDCTGVLWVIPATPEM
jgi:hypothetical protein